MLIIYVTEQCWVLEGHSGSGCWIVFIAVMCGQALLGSPDDHGGTTVDDAHEGGAFKATFPCHKKPPLMALSSAARGAPQLCLLHLYPSEANLKARGLEAYQHTRSSLHAL